MPDLKHDVGSRVMSVRQWASGSGIGAWAVAVGFDLLGQGRGLLLTWLSGHDPVPPLETRTTCTPSLRLQEI